LCDPPSLLSSRYQGLFPRGVKRPGREADHSPPPNAKVKECVELYLHFPNTPSCRCAQFKKSTGTTLPFAFYLLLCGHPHNHFSYLQVAEMVRLIWARILRWTKLLIPTILLSIMDIRILTAKRLIVKIIIPIPQIIFLSTYTLYDLLEKYDSVKQTFRCSWNLEVHYRSHKNRNWSLS
jgi:hypothetical protein